MLTITEPHQLRQTLAQWREQGEHIALVPTMGNLHEGHLKLIRRAALNASKTVVTIFVNPMQFDRQDDLAAYPRTLEEDKSKLECLKSDILFIPTATAIYPRGIEDTTYVEVPGLTDILCGANRPGHFRGVATVVVKLFNLVQPTVAVFGEKDYQQLVLIRRLVSDLDIPVEIMGVATEREPDGLAMSSRNNYLNTAERELAPALYQTLREMSNGIQHGEVDFRFLERQSTQTLEKLGLRPDYVSIRRQRDLTVASVADIDLVVLAAAWVGKARLIDNVTLSLNASR